MTDAGWSSLVARRAHNPKVVGSNPAPATNIINTLKGVFFVSALRKIFHVIQGTAQRRSPALFQPFGNTILLAASMPIS